MLNRAQQILYERGNWAANMQIETSVIPAEASQMAPDGKRLQELIGEDGLVVNWDGASSDSFKYLLSRGYPVYVRTAADAGTWLVGYDKDNYWTCDRPGGKAKAIASDDADELFEKNGCVFLSYILY